MEVAHALAPFLLILFTLASCIALKTIIYAFAYDVNCFCIGFL